VNTTNQSIAILVPAFKEGEVIAETLSPLVAANYTVIVIDDGSQDNTGRILEGLPVVRIRHPINLGQGASLQTGMDFALTLNVEVIVHFDADGQHDYRQIPDLVQPILRGEADVVLGSRFLRDSDRLQVPRIKRWVLRMGAVVSGLLTGVWLTDSHNGFRALSRKAITSIRLRERSYAHATEILLQIRRAGLRWIEVPTTIHYSSYSRSKGQPIANSINILIDLLIRRILN
jgi:glycosyltransferase involved in cell wall biosynthesis